MKKSYIIFFLLTLFIIIFTFSVFAQFVRVTSEFANIRLIPDTESIIIGKAFENDIFGYEGEENDWIKINMFSGEHRYVHHSLVKVISYGISASFSNDICQSLTKSLEEAEDRSLVESDNKYPLSNSENMKKNNEYKKMLFDRYILEIFHEFDLQPVIYQIAVTKCIEGSQSKIGQRPAVKSEFKIIEEKNIGIKALGEKKPSGEYSIGYKLCVIDGDYEKEDSVKVRRYNYLLESLAQRCSCEEINIADMSVAAQQILREKYGKEVKNITLLEAANEDLAYGCSKDDFAKYMTLAIQLLK
jgi:hypothetical protein